MTFVLADRVQETSTTTGTGTLTLAGAATQFQSFSTGIGANNLTYYGLLDGNGTAWETGIGTVGSGGTTLARTTVLESSNSNAHITLSSNTHTVYCNQPAGLIQKSVTSYQPVSAWTFVNQNGATLTSYVNGPLVWQCAGNIGTDKFSVVTLPSPSGSWTWTVNMAYMISNANTFACAGIDDGTKIQFFLIQAQGTANPPLTGFTVQHWPNGYSNPSSNGNDAVIYVSLTNPTWLQIVYDSVMPAISWNYSMDGFSWATTYSQSGSTYLTPANVFFGADINRGGTQTPSWLSINTSVFT